MSTSGIMSYMPSFSSINRSAFKGVMQTIGCGIGSELARTQCLLYAPAILNNLGIQVGSSNIINNLTPNWIPKAVIPWTVGRTTLSVSYDTVEKVSMAFGGMIGTKIAGYLADGTLFAWDLAMLGFGFSEIENEDVSYAPRRLQLRNHQPTRSQIINGQVVRS